MSTYKFIFLSPDKVPFTAVANTVEEAKKKIEEACCNSSAFVLSEVEELMIYSDSPN